MMRQVSSRNQRNKGLRVKNVLQLCILAAVCFWLLYQLKHSYNKKRALEESNLKASEKIVESQLEFLKLGRKDLSHGENSSGNGIHDKEEGNEVEEEEEQDQEMKQAMEDEEAGGDGDDEIDEQDQERDDEQEDQERADEEAENGEELTNEEDKDGQGEETEPLDDQDPEEVSAHKAREESYRRDDVSSAVRRENQAKISEDEDEVMENTEEKYVDADDRADGADDASKTNSDLSVGAADVAKDNITGVALAGSKINQDDYPIMNGTVIQKQGSKFGLNNSEGFPSSNHRELHANSTAASVNNNHVEAQANSISVVSNNQTETQTSSTLSDAIADGVPLQNGTLGRDSVQKHSIMVEMENSDQNKINLKNVVMDRLAERSNTTVGQEDAGEHSSVSLNTRNNGDLIKGEITESSHNMDTEEEKDGRIDLSMLPTIQNEVKSMADEAAE